MFDDQKRLETTLMFLKLLTRDNLDLAYLQEKLLGDLMVSGNNDPDHSRLVYIMQDARSLITSLLFIKGRQAAIIHLINWRRKNRNKNCLSVPENVVGDQNIPIFLERNQITHFTSVHIFNDPDPGLQYDSEKFLFVNAYLPRIGPEFVDKFSNCLVAINRGVFDVPRSMNVLDDVEIGSFVKLGHVTFENLGK